MIICAKISVFQEYDLMQQELKSASLRWDNHFNSSNYEGSWKVLSLRSIEGRDTIIPGLTANDIFADHPNMDMFPSIRKLLATFQCTVKSVRLLNLAAGAVIKPHCDHELSFEQGEARLHIPLVTNPDVAFYVQDQRVTMQPGECWYMNANLRHHVTNGGRTDRIHLVIDCEVNAWLRELINSAGYISRIPDYSQHQLLDMISALRFQHTITADQLADEFEKQYKQYQPLDQILSFLQKIGLAYQLETIEENTFLPGLKLRNGALVIDTQRLLYPGDVLHEAGHLACMPPNIRQSMNDNLEDCDMHRGGEMMALAWSYAACIFLEIDPEIVFHQDGYKGAGQNIIQNFNAGNIIGLPLLQWSGMSYDKSSAELSGYKPFPHMMSWMCTKETFESQAGGM
ncbi:mannose-6-phosphate isomerase-like protein (cupin superfamily) [Pedobacter cryoconitis]|uniref:Mannose-6-phosphate isomerase-like protein (Cupin superfamily) n=1 Tax=Pedobacter cryoconitis TaxID=188932 RepID=A0A7W8YXG8_9SPHI|nr:aspartyl/asparaginyl beta-hydroxylase domain-containing protein [Pedobacter cryoconitis]MBB5623624.1 mannose-6-phosphate isomerase-like protein (cupin superfamily) [Pedobacter cryoconitis]